MYICIVKQQRRGVYPEQLKENQNGNNNLQRFIIKLKAEMKKRIVKFYFQKIDGSLREAYGTMNPETIPATTGTRKPAGTVQTYFDTEKQEYRCFKKANLIRIA